jgi:Aldo/keto reductases, related to diketogulonate reductase
MQLAPIGFGTYLLDAPEPAATAVRHAVEAGYRHIDTAQEYRNEAAVAAGIAAADVDASDVTVATKLRTDNLTPERVRASAEASAARLDVDTIDLLYVHWPLDTYDPDRTLPALDALVDDGLVAHIGLSNFRPDQLRARASGSRTPSPPTRSSGTRCCRSASCSRSPARGATRSSRTRPSPATRSPQSPRSPTPAAAAGITPPSSRSRGRSTPRGSCPIPKATSPAHITENVAATQLALSAATRAAVDSVDTRRRIVDFPAAPWHHG